MVSKARPTGELMLELKVGLKFTCLNEKHIPICDKNLFNDASRRDFEIILVKFDQLMKKTIYFVFKFSDKKVDKIFFEKLNN
ncbi:hypothetical protein BpHYR1_012490 [Brachionus plicatilis]|uniref:Uncharacterized protein n=1 Tax=Brachionus plicatilis TaxID=10195 RepID=A0A3M7SVN7_BRAPC|nr:hypothetical protein BpHYR1_012490 [Brachionus plicatilis]